MPSIPYEVPVKSYPVPVITDLVLIELWNTEIAEYTPLEAGAPHPNTRDYPGFKLGSQKAIESTEKIIRRIWVTDATNQDLYNYALKYSGDATAAPIFVHSYRERKDTFAPRTRGSALQTVYKIALTNAGSGYTSVPTVSFSGGAGSGATAIAVLKDDKTIAEIVLTSGGSGYTSAPAIAVTGGGGAAGAATASIQPTGAVLVMEEPMQFPAESEYFALYFNVMRVYETLPGPWIPFTRWSEQLGPIQGRRRAVLNTSQVPTLTSTAKTTYEAREGSSIVAWQIEETNSDGTGSNAANPVFPTLTGSSRSEQVRGLKVTITEHEVPAGTAPSSGATVISSVVEAGQFFSTRRNTTVASLPPDEVSVYWEFVPIPTLLFPNPDLDGNGDPSGVGHFFYCNGTQFFAMVTRPVKEGGSSAIRKHRKTVGYLSEITDPTLDLSASAFDTTDLQYDGKAFSFNFNNVLNDAIAYTQIFSTTSGGGSCTWTEEYSFDATTPTATEFLAGEWYTRSYVTEPWGTEAWKFTHIEFYSAPENPNLFP